MKTLKILFPESLENKMKDDTLFTTSNNSQHSFESFSFFFFFQITLTSAFHCFLFCLAKCLTEKLESGYNKMK